MRTWTAMFCALALLAGCGDDAKTGGGSTGGAKAADAPTAIQMPDDWPSADDRRLDPNHMPAPFSAAQLRKACGEESRRVYKMEPDDGRVDYILYTFRDVTSSACIAEQTPCTPDGQTTGETRGGPTTWVELQRHASFPAESTRISEADIKVPAGTYRCMHYVVSRRGLQGPGQDKYWFAWDLPGPPVRLERYVGGELKLTMKLVKVEGVRTD